MLYCNICIVFNTVFFAYYINSIWAIINQFQQGSQDYSRNWTAVKLLLRDHKLPWELTHKIRDYLQDIKAS